MYQLETAQVKPINQNGFWLEEDVSSKTINQLFQDYKKAIFYLSNNFYPPGTIVYLAMEDIKSLPYLDITMTLADWFTAIGLTALPTTNVPPDLSPTLVKYGDAWKANYQIKTVPAVYAPDVVVPESERVDLLLQRANTDYELMGRRCLATVNGYLHLTESDENGFHIRDGGKSAKFCNKTQVGLLSFNKISNIQLIPITREMIQQPQYIDNLDISHDAIPLREKVYLNTGVDLRTKTILVSIGGYLHVLNEDVETGIESMNPDPVTLSITNGNVWITGISVPYDPSKPIKIGQAVTGGGIKPFTSVMEIVKTGNNITAIRLNNAPILTGSYELTFYNNISQKSIVDVVSDSTIVINWYKLNYAHRYFEQRRYMDMSSLGLSTSVNNPSQVSVEEFYSNETIKRYLELSQSFIIVLDSTDPLDFFIDYKMLESSKLPGTYYNHEEPNYPMQIGLGRLGNYWKTFDDQKWVLSVEESYYYYYGFETTQYLIETSIDESLDTRKPIDYADAYLMVMGID